MTKKVCLVDGSGYIFRAFYALPPLTSPEGIPVNAVLGFTNMFLRQTQKIQCDYCLVLFDAKRANFRNEIFADYKGTRKEIPEDLIPQFPIIREATDALNLNHLEMEGYEADDLIATYAEQAVAQGMEVVVVSADKDLMQLIRPGVEYFDPMKDKFFTPEDVKEKFGVYPDKVIDVQALAGDSTDNVPGVPGIGLKTAAQLVNDFGSVGEILSHAGEIKQEKRRQTLLDNKENALISLQLVTLKKDVPVSENITAFHCRCPQREQIVGLIDKYGFNSLRNRVDKWLVERCSTMADEAYHEVENTVFKPVEKHYELISDLEGLQKWAAKIKAARMMSMNIEATGNNPVFDRLVGLSFSVEPGIAAYLPLHGETSAKADLFSAPEEKNSLSRGDVAKVLTPLLCGSSILKIGHNIKSDLHFISQLIGAENIVFPIDDTAVISYDLDSSEHGHALEEMAAQFLEYQMLKPAEILGSGRDKVTLDRADPQQAMEYAAEKADIIFRLYQQLHPRLFKDKKISIYEVFDRPLISVLKKMEQCGIMVDSEALRRLKGEFEQKLQSYAQEIYQLAGEEFNIASPKQIGEILFGRQQLKGKKTPSGAWQTGADVLEQLAENGSELAAKILDWRGFAKLMSTYTDALLEQLDAHSRIHTTYNQVVVNTGRLASNNPNLQNIPIRSEEGRKIRSCFIAPKGYKLISSDYSQVELRLLASVANVTGLKQAFEAGVDVHAATASKVFGVPYEDVDANLRRHAKAINFGIVYGISQYGLAKQLDVKPEEAKAYIDAYFQQMPEIKRYMEDTIEFARKHGYVLTPFGRKCSILGINDKNKRLANNAERAAINAPIQGGAADIIKLAMNQMSEKLQEAGLKTRMLLQVHDELVFEAPDDEVEKACKIIKETMENVVAFDVPFKAEVGCGQNWNDAH